MIPRNQQRLEQIAAGLERNQTYSERVLGAKMKKWFESRKMVCAPQIALHGCIVDFFFPEVNIAVELDGRGHDSQRDSQRDARLLKNGVRVLRFPNPRSKTDLNAVLYRIYSEVRYQTHRLKRYGKVRFSSYPQHSSFSQE